MPPRKKPFKLPKPELVVKQDKNGFEYVMLDILTSHFYWRTHHAHFALVSRDCAALPFEGYVVPFAADNLCIEELLSELEMRAEEGLQIPEDRLPTLPEEVLAIRIIVTGAQTGNQY